MRALILAAGYGSRLMPYTRFVPKPLFTVGGKSLLDILIRRLAAAGCEAVVVNTHHLHDKIEAFVASGRYSIPVSIRYEPMILGTGGAVRNLADFWDHRPFMVVNSDILTDIDFAEVYRAHLAHDDPVTLVLYDDPAFNTVTVASDGGVKNFDRGPCGSTDFPCFQDDVSSCRRLTFSGIQIVDPWVVKDIPEGFSSIVDRYCRLLADGGNIRGHVAAQARWSDLGTPERYRTACVDTMANEAFASAWPDACVKKIRMIPLSGDGSDRRWFRLTSKDRSLIMADHGIYAEATQGEAGAFEDIGRHLYGKNVAVPRIHHADRFSGLVFLEDLGDVHLQDAVKTAAGPEAVVGLYRQVMDRLLPLWIEGRDGFDPRWTWQTERYDREMILKAECGYFRDAFLSGYLGMAIPDGAFRDEFERIADGVLAYGVPAFMHRDIQSRNIMMNGRGPHFIDFQGGRTGPIQYDLASLLIDPYVALLSSLQERLLADCIDRLTRSIGIDPRNFMTGYRYCCLARNLQMLGAFGFLTRVKNKPGFERYIPAALRTLSKSLANAGPKKFPDLSRLALDLNRRMNQGKTLDKLRHTV